MYCTVFCIVILTCETTNYIPIWFNYLSKLFPQLNAKIMINRKT